MQSDRVRAILEGVGNHQEAAVTPEERASLVAQSLLKNVAPATRDRWVADMADLPSLRNRVRELSRQALATPGPDAPPELRQMIASLEEMTRAKATLDALVWNGPTQEYLTVPLLGRTVLEDLKTWQARLAGRDFDAFQGEMSQYRAGLAQLVSRASMIYNGLVTSEQMQVDEFETAQPFTTVDLRFASMILAKRAVDPFLLIREFEYFHHDTNWGSFSREDHLVASAILASLPWDYMTARGNFERLRIQLEYHGIHPEERIIVAASLADLPEGWWNPVLAKIDEIMKARPNLNALLVSALARSPFPSSQALARFDGAIVEMGTKGYKDGIQLQAAASILASAQIPAAALVDRFAATTSQVAGAFDPPFAPAAMLAASPLEPAEAVDVFRDCIGTVTRMNFFELTLEIEELALIMSYGVAPLGLGYLGANLPAGAPPPVPVAAVQVPVFGASWYAWHNYWVYRPIGRYIATHPVHIHTVAAFG
jgi:hypothetical protein